MNKIIKKTLSEQIYEILRDEIITKKLTFGNKLVNRDLQNRFGVSSTPIRDAINRLYLDGLVEEVTKTGAKIISFDLKFACEINELICILCTSAVEFSFYRNDNINIIISKLENILEKQSQVLNNEEYFYLDYQFHKTFFDYANNQFLKNTYKKYNVLRSLLTKYAYTKDSNKESALQQHFKILEAYKNKNIELAKSRMIEHYTWGIKRLEEAFLKENE